MKWLQRIPSWLFSIAFAVFVVLLYYLGFTGVEFRYKDSLQFVMPSMVSPDLELDDDKRLSLKLTDQVSC